MMTKRRLLRVRPDKVGLVKIYEYTNGSDGIAVYEHSPGYLSVGSSDGCIIDNAEALRLAIALIQATPEDDAEHTHVEVDPVRYAIALIRAAGKP